ncbi:solute carrier family 35 member F2-like isoform X4 [Camellia sinensis]|uniref:solute carrier family 35 member F2-like isoform X4 n=1 Tax=Camellia sinensis TaxID=4442 RepID=UPI0010355976|nr:solute carrier family 35 member F2-like isoform X4 [Camellia sinensis]
MDIGWWRNNGALWPVLYALFLGQVVSFLMSLMSFTSSLVANLGVDTPLTLSFFSYLALALVYGSILLYRRHKLLVPWYCMGHCSYLVLPGHTIFAVAVLWCGTLCGRPWVSACLRCWGGSKPLLGDVLVIAGTLFFAMSNVGEEFCVKKKDRIEVVAMLGLFGTLVSVCQIAILERESLESVTWSAEIILSFAGYGLATFMFYTLVPFVLKMSGATMFNLSILTSDMWAVVIRIFFYHQQVDWLYYLSFAIVVVGLIIYSKIEKEGVPVPALEDGNLNVQYQAITEEESAES